jgi:hypothetical protein
MRHVMVRHRIKPDCAAENAGHAKLWQRQEGENQ